MKKYILFAISIAMFALSCNEPRKEGYGFVDVDVYQLINFITEAENGESVSIIAEDVEVTTNDINETPVNFSRILTIINEETIEALYIHLNLDEEGNTTEISSIRYQIYQNDTLNEFSYSANNNVEDNPQLLDYTIEQSTKTRLKINMSGVLSNYNVMDNSYATLQFSDIGLDVSF